MHGLDTKLTWTSLTWVLSRLAGRTSAMLSWLFLWFDKTAFQSRTGLTWVLSAIRWMRLLRSFVFVRFMQCSAQKKKRVFWQSIATFCPILASAVCTKWMQEEKVAHNFMLIPVRPIGLCFDRLFAQIRSFCSCFDCCSIGWICVGQYCFFGLPYVCLYSDDGRNSSELDKTHVRLVRVLLGSAVGWSADISASKA